MKLAKVEAATMQDALRKIRSTLGDDAMIVGTRTLRRGGLMGVGGREVVEVYVTDNRPRIQSLEALNSRRQPAGGVAAAAETSARPTGTLERSLGEGSVQGAGVRPAGFDSVSLEITKLRSEIRDLVREKEEAPAHPFMRLALERLLDRDVEPKLARRIVDQLRAIPLPVGSPDQKLVDTVLAAQIRRLIPTSQIPYAEGRPRVVALIGPTGVGKTTTIAKLAARARLSENRRAALVTLDTFRIAAVDQLQKYAQIIGIPLGVATDPVECQSAVNTLAQEGAEVIFIDSAGRSQRDEMKMSELREFLQVLQGAEVHLVLSATTQPKTLKSIAERFAAVGFHRLILTKIDETASFGAILDPLVAIGKPVSYVTDGQNVPDDIMTGDPERLAELILRTARD